MALKFFAMDKRFDVIASGSLLGINYNEVPSFPVGYVDHLELSSLDFEEFCWASGVSEDSINDLKSYFDNLQVVPSAMHDRMLELFKEYIVVGGMPRVVDSFVSTNDFSVVLKIQRGILEYYKDDIAKYALGSEKMKARECFMSIPRQLVKENKKFQYKVIHKGASSKMYDSSLMWLYDTGIINYCYLLRIPEAPFDGNVKGDVFKIYMRDTGLLMASLEDGAQEDIIDGNLGIYKGAIYENVIADIFAKSGKKLYYFSHNYSLEIDFIVKLSRCVTAVEVKSADNTKSKSMDSLLSNWDVKRGIKLSTKNIGYKDNVINYPLYMAMFL